VLTRSTNVGRGRRSRPTASGLKTAVDDPDCVKTRCYAILAN